MNNKTSIAPAKRVQEQTTTDRIAAMEQYLMKKFSENTMSRMMFVKAQKSIIVQPWIVPLMNFIMILIPALKEQGIGLVITGGYATFLRILESSSTSGLFYMTDDVDIQLCNMQGHSKNVDDLRTIATQIIEREFEKWNTELINRRDIRKFKLYNKWKRKTKQEKVAIGSEMSGNIPINITGNFNGKLLFPPNLYGTENGFKNTNNPRPFETICEITFSTKVCVDRGERSDIVLFIFNNPAIQWQIPTFKTFKLINNLMAASNNFEARLERKSPTDSIFPEKILGWLSQLKMLNMLLRIQEEKKKRKKKQSNRRRRRGGKKTRRRKKHKKKTQNP